MTELQRRSRYVRDALARAVAQALERKRRLGQYAVVFENGKPVRIEANRTREQEHP